MAVLCFHDALETFLQLGLDDHEGEMKERSEFLQLFDTLKTKAPGLENRDAPVRVNDARKVVKHKSIEISGNEVERRCERTRVFLEQNSTTIFGVDLFNALLSDRIGDEKVRDSVQAAEAALEAGHFQKSVKQAPIAFDELTRRHGLVSHISHIPRSAGSQPS